MDGPVHLLDQAQAQAQAKAKVASLCESGRPQQRCTSFYDVAAELLTELLPGWDDGLDEDDLSDSNDEEDEEDAVLVRDEGVEERLGAPPVTHSAPEDALIVDVSYLACLQETERFLVEREGFSREDAVLEGLRAHLLGTRERAVRAVQREALRIVRPPGCPA